MVTDLRYHASPTIFCLGERLAPDEVGELVFHLDLKAFSERLGMDGHAMNERPEESRAFSAFRAWTRAQVSSSTIRSCGVAIVGQ